MRVKRDFDLIYATEADPWSIGDADSPRYDLYVERILAASTRRKTVLEIGCGFGALLARLEGQFDQLIGVELSEQAVRTGKERYPFIEFHEGSLADPGQALPADARYDTIIVSDVLCYLREHDKQAALRWISEHLEPGGLAFIAGWSPGGRYLNREEFRNLVERDLAIEAEEVLETEHVLLTCRYRRSLVAVTVDYETWQPQPEGVALDWDVDVFKPTERLLDLCDAVGVTLTLFAEVGEYLWLAESRPQLARKMEAQWRDAVARGHDVQLHLHPAWLPEFGPRDEDGRWSWDENGAHADDYPGDLNRLIERCKAALEAAIRPVERDYEVIAFRAGTYEAQPFARLYDALTANGIWCDTSVVPGDRRAGRRYDYTYAYADHQPWFASRYDPQLKAPPGERAVIELPVFTPVWGERWTFDGDEGARFAHRLFRRISHEHRHPSTTTLRFQARLRLLLNDGYGRMKTLRSVLNRLIPRRVATFMAGYSRERLTMNDYFVLVAHTKGKLDFEAIAAGLRTIARQKDVEFVSVTKMAQAAMLDLDRVGSRDPDEEAVRQVRREYSTQMSDERHVAQTARLYELIPLDRKRILDVGCGRGVGTAALADMFQWAAVVGVDVGADFIERARSEFAHDRLSFEVASFESLACPDHSFDCVVADNSLEHAFDVDATLGQLHRVLDDGGCLVAAVPPDGLNPSRTCDNHTWKTIPSDVRARLSNAGFSGIEIACIDTFRELALPPFPPSDNKMLYVRAWKRAPEEPPLRRVRELTDWAYQTLDPEVSHASNEPLEILAGGTAWCAGYTAVLGEALVREGFDVTWMTMTAEGHARGRGPTRWDTHEVLEVKIDESRRVICDPMAGIVFEAALQDLLEDPSRADVPRAEDERYAARGYALYSTSAWYSLVRKVARRRQPRERERFVRTGRKGPNEPSGRRG